MKFVSISSLQKTTKPMLENDVVCVLKNNEPAFYTVSVERMNELLSHESVSKKAVKHIIDNLAQSLSIENINRG